MNIFLGHGVRHEEGDEGGGAEAVGEHLGVHDGEGVEGGGGDGDI